MLSSISVFSFHPYLFETLYFYKLAVIDIHILWDAADHIFYLLVGLY